MVVINPACTPLLARKTAQAQTLDELLFAMIVLGDDRLIEQTIISQAKYAMARIQSARSAIKNSAK